MQEIRDPRTFVVKILGDSMHPILGHGWKVMVDPRRTLFRPGKIVMVYVRDQGTTIGIFEEDDSGARIRKHNLEYGGPVEIPLTPGEWHPIGTLTKIVEAPVVSG